MQETEGTRNKRKGKWENVEERRTCVCMCVWVCKEDTNSDAWGIAPFFGKQVIR
jgi:hypothetical protein